MNVKKESVILASLAWNPHGWKKASPDPRKGIKGAAHEALNFDFDKKGIDKDGFIHGYVRWGGKGTPKKRFCDGGIIIFYTKNLENMEQIVGIYGKVQIIVPVEKYPGKGFYNGEYWVNICAEKNYSMQFPIPLDAERYKKFEKGPRGRFFNYQNVAFAQKIILDELNILKKKGGYRNEIAKLTDINKSCFVKSDELEQDEGNDNAVTIDESIDYEGRKTQYIKEITVFKRNPEARKKCLDFYFKNKGHYNCQICGFDFEERYGTIGKQVIEVHHIESHAQRSEKSGEHIIDPKKDLIPVCSNCHNIIHRQKPPLEIDNIKKRLK